MKINSMNLPGNHLNTFNHSMFGAVRTVAHQDGDVWFVAKDVAEALGYSNPRDAIGKHCKGVAKCDAPTNSGVQEVSIIPERDVYRLVMRSRLPSAEQFEEWVVSEVLPTIRKTGSYNTDRVALPDFTNPAEAARAWADEHEAKQTAQAEAKRLNQVCNTVTRQFIPGQTAARFCMQLNGVNCQQVQSWLVSRGHLINEGRRGYRPSAESRDRYFKLYVADNNGKETYQAQLTQKGARWLYNKYLKGELPMKKTWNGQFTHAVFEQPSPVNLPVYQGVTHG